MLYAKKQSNKYEKALFTMNEPLVTIGVCVRNAELTIKEAIESIIHQDYSKNRLEVAFVDDGSEDSTLPIILDYVSNMDMQTKVCYGRRRGLGAARQAVVDNAKSNYIVWVDAGLSLSKDYVRKQVRFMEKNPKVGIAKGRYGISTEKNIVATLENIGDFIQFWRDAGDFVHSGRETSKLPGTGGSIYRVRAIKQVGGFDKEIKGACEDTDIAWKIKAAGWLICVTGAIFHKRRQGTWIDLWDRYFWYGYGLHYVLHKYGYKGIFSPLKMVPPTSFIEGLLYSTVAYKLTRRKIVFLLPFEFGFKRAAVCLGFTKSHIDSYGH